MYCSKCGKKLSDKDRFCPECGQVVSVKKVIKGQHVRNRHIGRRIIIAAVCMVMLAVVGIVVYEFTGQEISKEQYLAAVENEDEKWGVVNEKGEEVIPCEYDFVYSGAWEQGVTVIGEIIGEDEDGRDKFKYGLINSAGEIVVSPKYDDYSIGNGFIAMAEMVGGVDEEGLPLEKWGFLDSKGELVTEFKYQYWGNPVFNGSNGLAIVGERMELNNENEDAVYNYGVINEKGEEILPLEYSYIGDEFLDDTYLGNSGLISVAKQEGNEIKYGFVNYDNEIIVPIIYDAVEGFSNYGLASVCKDGKWGYVNDAGETVIPCQYKYAGLFSDNGLAFVKNEEGSYECINEYGEIVIPNEKYSAYGNWNAYWLDANFASFGIELNEEDKLYGVINKEGDIIIEPEYKLVLPKTSNSQLFRLWLNTSEVKYKLATLDGELLTGTYDYVGQLVSQNGWCRVGTSINETDETGRRRFHYSYVDKNGKIVLELPNKYLFAGDFVPI